MPAENTLRYLKTDFQSHKDALLQRIRARYPKVWNDFLTGSFGIVLVDLVAWSMATLAFTVNRLAAEQFIPTMTLRESAVRLGSLVGYRLRGPVPSVVLCEASIASSLATPVVIKAGTLIRTSDSSGISFEVSKDYTIEAGDLTPKTGVVTISANVVGANVLATFVSVTNKSNIVDLADTTIDLTQYAEVGQTFRQIGDSTGYAIDSIESAPGSVGKNSRIILVTPWQGSTASGVAAEIYDQRMALVQGQSMLDRFISPVDASPLFAVKLSQAGVVDGSVSVNVNGEAWSEIRALAGAASDDSVFQVKTFASGQTLVTFGDGTFGRQIPSEASVMVSYRVGGGVSGNIPLNSIDTSITGIIPNTSSPVTVSVKNSTSSGSGGRDSETLDEARIGIPYYTKANDRAVTLDDYQTLASQFSHPQFGSVAYARSAVRTENSLLEGNQVVVYAWATGSLGGLVPLSAQLKVALKDYLQTKAVGTDFVQVYDGTERPVPVSVRFKTLAGFDVKIIKDVVSGVLTKIITILRPGQPIIYSDMVKTLAAVPGVDNLDMATPVSDLVATNSTELFTVPSASFAYKIERIGVGTPVTTTDNGATSLYVSQSPVYPLQAWSFRMFLGSNELTVVPGTDAGFVELYGDNLSTSKDSETDEVKLFDPEPSLKFKSTVNLLTGHIRLWLKGAPGELKMKLIPVQGYSAARSVNIYVGYTGDNSLSKRREIRASLRAWSNGLAIGGTLYGSEQAGIQASKSNIKAVVANVPGVVSVNRVALETPSSSNARVSCLETELLRLGLCALNNELD